MTRSELALAALLVLVNPVVQACGSLQFENPWIRQSPPGMPMYAAYFRVINTGTATVTIIEVTSAAFNYAALHETKLVDGHSQMRELGPIELTAGAAFEAHPGGAHIMLGGANAEVTEGSSFDLGFRCLGDSRLTVQFPVLRDRKPVP